MCKYKALYKSYIIWQLKKLNGQCGKIVLKKTKPGEKLTMQVNKPA